MPSPDISPCPVCGTARKHALLTHLIDRRMRRRLPSLTRPDLATLEAGLVAKRKPTVSRT